MTNELQTIQTLMKLYSEHQPAFTRLLAERVASLNPAWPRVDFNAFMTDGWERPSEVNWALLLEKIEQSMRDFQSDADKLMIVQQDVLEPLTDALTRREIDPSLIVPYVGPLSKAHIQAIDRGFGGKTPGFENED